MTEKLLLLPISVVGVPCAGSRHVIVMSHISCVSDCRCK